METGTSKTSSIKALLLKGWHEHWTDIQWGIHIKTILPRGVSGDVYNLADVILQQALVGNAPNELLLSYLIHCLSSQLVSYAAVLSVISKYDSLHKPQCVKRLLILLESILDSITCRSKPEESVLPTALLSTVHWLLYVYYNSMNKCLEAKELITKPVLILDKLAKNPFALCLLYVAKFEDRDTYSDILKRCRDIERKSETCQDVCSDIIPALHIFSKLEANVKLELPQTGNGVDYSIQSILLITVLLNPTTETHTFVNHLLTVQQLKGYSNSKLYMDFVRGSFMNLNEALKEEEASQWGAFVYIKVPTIIQQLAYYYHGFPPYDSNLTEQASTEIVRGFLSLTEYCPLLHTLDLRTSCSTTEYLLTEMVTTTRTISDEEKNQILSRVNEIWRRNKYDKVGSLEGISAHPSGPIPTVILNTGKPALARILKTLDTEFEKIQEPLLSILGQFINGKSFEIILALATIKEVLHTFVMKLIKVNELCQQISLNEGKLAYTKSMLFDITFLILSAIVQRYGSKIIFGNRWGNSFFETWVKDCMVEEENNKAMTALVKGHDSDKIKALINWLDSSELDIRAVPMKWGEVCLTMPAVMKEIHDLWRNSKLSSNDVKRKLDAIRSCQMYSLSVCSISWLSSYMQILTQDELLKPRNMVQQFLNPPCDDSQLDLRSQSMKLFQQENARDSRCWLALDIMCKMQYCVGPSMMPIKLFTQSSHCILSKESVFKQLQPVWDKILKHGSLSLQLVQDMKTIFSIISPSMFIKFMIDEVMKQRYKRELNKAVDLLFGLFYFNIEECSIALLTYIPHYLLFKPTGTTNNVLIEPQSSAIARLVAYSIFAPAGCYSAHSNVEIKMEIDQDVEEFCSPAKITKMNDDDLDAGDDDENSSSGGGSGYTRKPAHPVFSEALLKAVDVMFRAFNNVARRAEAVSRDTYFVLRVLEQIVVCGKEASKPIVSRLPDELVSSLIKLIPDEFSMKLILNLYTLNTAAGRKAAVRDLCLLQNLTVLYY